LSGTRGIRAFLPFLLCFSRGPTKGIDKDVAIAKGGKRKPTAYKKCKKQGGESSREREREDRGEEGKETETPPLYDSDH